MPAVAVTVSATDIVSLPIRGYTHLCLQAAVESTGKPPDELIRLGLHSMGLGFPGARASGPTDCSQPHRTKSGKLVRCRRVTKPHPGLRHVWWSRTISRLREEWD